MYRPILLLLIAAFFCLACGKTSDQKQSKQNISERVINVVSTTGMIGDAVKNVGGDRVSVISLMGAGVDPHLYKASEGDVTRMSGADIIFYNGLHLEGKMAEVFEKMQRRIKTVAVTEKIDKTKLLTPPEFSGSHDPHIWFDVRLWMEAITHISQILQDFDPAHAESYRANTQSYLAELEALDAFARQEIARIDPAKRALVTAHDAFNYFGKAYDIEVRGLQGISTASETGTGDVQALAQFIVDRRIPAIFVETSVPPRYIEALQAAVQSRGFDVKIGGNLFSDAMGNPGTPEGVYTGMVRHNVTTIVNALTGDASQPLSNLLP